MLAAYSYSRKLKRKTTAKIWKETRENNYSRDKFLKKDIYTNFSTLSVNQKRKKQ
jgi:hypothetical protein